MEFQDKLVVDGTGGVTFGDSMGASVAAKGGDGTSYSGGSGSGGINNNCRSTTGAWAPKDNVGEGGNGRAYRSEPSWAARYAGGGTGNPGGAGGKNTSGSRDNIGNEITFKGNDGTGGLLVIWSSIFNNNGLISSTGIASTTAVTPSGGASGGGSVNVFCNSLKNIGEYDVSGGASENYGGAGGNGTVTIGTMVEGNFVKE